MFRRESQTGSTAASVAASSSPENLVSSGPYQEPRGRSLLWVVLECKPEELEMRASRRQPPQLTRCAPKIAASGMLSTAAPLLFAALAGRPPALSPWSGVFLALRALSPFLGQRLFCCLRVARRGAFGDDAEARLRLTTTILETMEAEIMSRLTFPQLNADTLLEWYPGRALE